MSEAVRSEAVPERRVPRWMWIALVGSLALNLLVAGVLASAAWRLRHAEVGDFGFRGRLSGLLDSLPPERSSELRPILERAKPAVRPLWREAWQERREAARLFMAEPFDRQAFAAAYDRLLESEMTARRAHLRLITELAEELTVAERRAFLERRGRRGRSARDSAEANRDGARER